MITVIQPAAGSWLRSRWSHAPLQAAPSPLGRIHRISVLLDLAALSLPVGHWRQAGAAQAVSVEPEECRNPTVKLHARSQHSAGVGTAAPVRAFLQESAAGAPT